MIAAPFLFAPGAARCKRLPALFLFEEVKKMNYRLIQVGCWDLSPENRRFNSLSAREKGVWFFLNTNRHTHISGLYLLNLGLIADHFPELQPGAIGKILQKLEALELIFYDKKRGLLLLPEFLQNQQAGVNAKLKTAILLQLKQFYPHFLVGKFLEFYPSFRELFRDTLSDRVSDEREIREQRSENREERSDIRDQKKESTPSSLSEGGCLPVTGQAVSLVKEEDWDEEFDPFSRG